MGDKVYTVSGLTRKIRGLLELEVGEVWIEGEVSNHRAQASGHHYFTLKDSGAQISCVLFRGHARTAKALPQNGVQIQAFGEISVYEARGQYQLVVRNMQLQGAGQLQARFEELKHKLHAEGLFDEIRKKPIPRIPRTIGIVTSPTGAALKDMINVLERRSPWLQIYLFPVRVQGDGAEWEIVRAIETANAKSGTSIQEIDTLLLARGGGSIEDLWNFNEESVARAIAASAIPVVSGVGHEIDFTISDFAADLRAPTPSAAAELIAPDVSDLRGRLEELSRQLDLRVQTRLSRQEEILDNLAQSPVIREPERVVREHEQTLDHYAVQLRAQALEGISERKEQVDAVASAFAVHSPKQLLDNASERTTAIANQLRVLLEGRLSREEEHLRSAGALLHSLGPRSVFERGFSLTTDATGNPLSSVEGLTKGDQVLTQLSDGTIESEIEKVRPAKNKD